MKQWGKPLKIWRKAFTSARKYNKPLSTSNNMNNESGSTITITR